MKKEYNVQVLERAIKTIEALSKHPSGIELRFLADELALNKTTVFRILATLLPYDYVRQDPYTGKYRLGYRFIGLSNTVMQNIDIHEVAMPYLDELSRLTGEVVHLVIADHDMGIYIAKVDKSSGSVKMVSNIGSHLYLHSSGAGKILLAYMDSHRVEGIIERVGMPKFTENTIDDKTRLFEELHRVREQGYAIDEIENENGIRCVAAPVFNCAGDVIAAMSISGFTLRITRERVPELVHIILEYSRKLSGEFGYEK